MASQGNSQTFREDQIPVVLKFFQKISEGGTLPSSFYKDHHSDDPTSD